MSTTNTCDHTAITNNISTSSTYRNALTAKGISAYRSQQRSVDRNEATQLNLRRFVAHHFAEDFDLYSDTELV